MNDARAYNDGHYLETELKLADSHKGSIWSFVLGEIKTSAVLRIDEKREWTELTDRVDSRLALHPRLLP